MTEARERPDAGKGVGRGAGWQGVADLIGVHKRNRHDFIPKQARIEALQYGLIQRVCIHQNLHIADNKVLGAGIGPHRGRLQEVVEGR